MKKKIGTLIDARLYKELKAYSVEGGRSISDIIQNALSAYLATRQTSSEQRREAFDLFCEHPLPLSREQFQSILDEDSLEQ